MPIETPVEHAIEDGAEAAQPYANEVFSGQGAAVSLLRLQVARISPHFRTALVTGERGVGKESVAREMHRLSAGASGPFTRVEVGAFAQQYKRVELRGVLYLYGLERLEPSLQEPLALKLRTIQRETRIVFASEFDLRAMLATGRLRQSLSSRVGALEIRVGALRDRMEDFDGVAASLLKRAGGNGWFGQGALETMKSHDWPGNLAELFRVARLVRRVEGEIRVGDLPELAADAEGDDDIKLEQVMQRHVFEVLQRCSGNKLRAAKMLGISRSTLYRMLEASGTAE
jgi:two-component system response regulator HydG